MLRTCVLLLFLFPTFLHAQAPTPETTVTAPPVTETAAATPTTDAMWKYGPSLSLGLIQPYMVSADVLYNRQIEVGLAYGQFAHSMDGKTEIELEMQSMHLSTRWFPWAGSFYLGMLLGRRVLSGEFTREVAYKKAGESLDFNAVAEITLTSYYVTPHLGWRWLWDSGFLLGMDMGYHVTLKASAESEVSASDPLVEAAAKSTSSYKALKSDVDDILVKAAKLHMPYLTLLRIGYFF